MYFSLYNYICLLENNKKTNSGAASQNAKRGENLKDSVLWGIYWLRKANLSMQKIADVVELSKATVQTVLNPVDQTGTPNGRTSPGRSKKLNERDTRSLELITRRKPFASYTQINMEAKASGIVIHRDILIKYLKDSGFDSYFAAHKPKFTEENRLKRLRM